MLAGRLVVARDISRSSQIFSFSHIPTVFHSKTRRRIGSRESASGSPARARKGMLFISGYSTPRKRIFRHIFPRSFAAATTAQREGAFLNGMPQSRTYCGRRHLRKCIRESDELRSAPSPRLALHPSNSTTPANACVPPSSRPPLRGWRKLPLAFGTPLADGRRARHESTIRRLHAP